jgi:hypothetical protein
MKNKVFSFFTLIFLMGSLTSATIYQKPVEDDFGRASDCVRMSRGATLALADFAGEDANGDNFEFYLAIYMTMYETCLEN